jgi:peptidyl-prolyl cis-trans isomerase C
MKTTLYPALGLSLALGLAACGNGGNAGNATGSPGGEQTRAEAPSNSEPLATVNGRVITQEQFDFHLERRTQGRPQLASQEDRKALLDELVDLTLLASEADRQGLANDPVVAGRVENLRSAILAQALVEQLEREDVSEEELKAEYEKRFAQDGQLEYNASHILVEDEETARALIEQLQGEADFAELAQEHSKDPGSGAKGGDLGWFQPDDMVEPFSQAVQALEPGQITEEPVQSQFGWHVIRLQETREATPPDFEQVKQPLRQMLVQQRMEERLEQLRDQAEVDIQRQPN